VATYSAHWIADPGFRVLAEAIARGIPLEVLPGPTAFVPALLLSGFPVNRFVFEGFVPVKDGARRRLLESLKNETRTVIFYESPYRLIKALKDIEEVLGNPTVVCARELTKKFEEVKKAPAGELREYFSQKTPRGEFVLLLKQ